MALRLSRRSGRSLGKVLEPVSTGGDVIRLALDHVENVAPGDSGRARRFAMGTLDAQMHIAALRLNVHLRTPLAVLEFEP